MRFSAGLKYDMHLESGLFKEEFVREPLQKAPEVPEFNEVKVNLI